MSLDLRIALLLACCSILGTILAVALVTHLPEFYLKLYISILIMAVGLVIIVTMKKNYRFSWGKLISLGMLAAFNKGISGGGYGPAVTGGQLLVGVNSKSAVGITSFAEALTCIVGVIAYLSITSKTQWGLTPYLLVGSILSVPFSVYTVKMIKTEKLRFGIGIFTMLIGLITMLKILL